MEKQIVKETIKNFIKREDIIEDMLYIVEQFGREFSLNGNQDGVEVCEELITELEHMKHEEIMEAI